MIYINSSDSTKSQNVYNKLAERILKFNDIGLSPVPLNTDNLSGSRTLGKSLCQNVANFIKPANWHLEMGQVKEINLKQKVSRKI